MTFVKHHKHHLGIFIILIIIAVVSGYFAFRPNITQNSINITQNTRLPEPEAQADPPATQSLLLRAGGGQAIDKTQITENKKNDLTPTATLSTATTSAVSANGGTAGQAIQQLINPVTIKINGQGYQTEFTSSTTVLDLMTKLKSENKLSFSGKEYTGMGMFVEEINGVKNDSLAGKYWIYYINGQSAQVGISNYIIKPNDLIEWKYENAKF